MFMYAPIAPPDRIKLLDRGFPVDPLRSELAERPELWNQFRARTEDPDSPHHDVDDIWCRFAPAGKGGGVEHYSVWYPPAKHLPAVRWMANELMFRCNGTALGGILITRIPAGKSVKRHKDIAWHAQFYEKLAVQIDAAPGQAFQFDGQSLVTEPGDVYTFDNRHEHWVTNDSDQPRVTAIFCIRVEREAP